MDDFKQDRCTTEMLPRCHTVIPQPAKTLTVKSTDSDSDLDSTSPSLKNAAKESPQPAIELGIHETEEHFRC